jgi:crossover junction endodeoxyribonuclease RusA
MFVGGEIILPWPSSDLSPNATSHAHWRKRQQAAKRAKADGYMLAAMVGVRPPTDDRTIVLTMEFHPPDRRRRDLDNMFGSCKHALDGIAQAMGVDDQRFGFVLSREDPVKDGKIVVRVGWEAE